MWFGAAVTWVAFLLVAVTVFSVYLVFQCDHINPIDFKAPKSGGRKTGAAFAAPNDAVLEKSTPAAVTAAPAVPDGFHRGQLSNYALCLQSPEFLIEDKARTTKLFSCVSPADRQKLLKSKTVILDASRCKSSLQTAGERTSNESAAFLEPLDINMRFNSTDHPVFRQVFCEPHFTFMHMLAKFAPQLSSGVTFLDAGANIGLASILFSQFVSFYAAALHDVGSSISPGEVFAVEANPSTFDVLVSNSERFTATSIQTNVASAIATHPVALNGSSLPFAGKKTQEWGYRIADDLAWADWVEKQKDTDWIIHRVESTSLPMLQEMTKAKRFDFIKLDIEGQEKHILTDPESIEVLCEATCIFMELHERFYPGCKAAYDSFIAGGCSGGRSFNFVAQTGEYTLICQQDAINKATVATESSRRRMLEAHQLA